MSVALSPSALQRMADRIADPMPRVPLTRREQASAIIAEVARAHGLERYHIIGQGRDARTCDARFEVCHRLRFELKLSLPKIGKLIGGRHHSCVLRGIRVWVDRHPVVAATEAVAA